MVKRILKPFKKIIHFYVEGFKSMTIGKTLWTVIILKLVVIFLILRVFFFQPYLKGNTDKENTQSVSQELINRSNNNTSP